MGQNKRMEGSRYEQLAARYLEQKGMDVLELNYRCRTGEIDIIARDGGYLVFVEVKYRKTKRAGYALEAIDSRKAEHGFPESAACRFDAVGIDGEQITHLINAF